MVSPTPYKRHCIFCKSPFHDYRRCPMAFRAKRKEGKQEYMGQSPNVFVGSYGYPRVNVGFLNVEEYTEHDEPLKWSRENKQIPAIVDLRTSLINSTFNQHVKGFGERLSGMAQEVSMAKRPADMEVQLSRKPKWQTSFNQDAKPHGPSVRLRELRFTENVRVDHRVERAVDDADLKAGPAMGQLYGRGVDEHKLTRLLSVGNLGVKAQRRFVPTRWSITAVDDTVGKRLIDEVKRYRESDPRVFTGGYLGNEYVILCLDDLWSYELFEGYLPLVQRSDDAWETDYENYHGRTTYAEETAGGYYAARLAILEKLRATRRQAAVLALRYVTEEYSAPLGVWVVREAVRKAMANPQSFRDREELKRWVVAYCRRRFNDDASRLFARSRLLANLKRQKRLKHFF